MISFTKLQSTNWLSGISLVNLSRSLVSWTSRLTPLSEMMPSSAKAYDASINSFTDDGIISDKGVSLDVQLTKERLKLTKDIPLSQLVDWRLVKEIK